MSTIKQNSALTTLVARRQVLHRKLLGVEQQIVQAKKGLAQLNERIRSLERGQRRAA
jgi:hypothetical protein